MKTLLITLFSLYGLLSTTEASDCHNLMKGFLKSDVVFSQLKPADIPDAYKLAKRVFITEKSSDLRNEIMTAAASPRFEDNLIPSDQSSFLEFYVARDAGGDFLGMIGTHQTEKDAHKALWVTTFAVGENARGRGIGASLLKRVEARALLMGKTEVRLYTNNSPEFESAQHLYEKNGYSIYKTWFGEAPGGYDTFMRQKILVEPL